MRILLVEDEPALRPLLIRALERGGHQVSCCGECAVARELAREMANELAAAESDTPTDTPLVLVSDLSLPDGSGLDLALELLEANLVSHAVLTSGYALDDIFVPPPLQTRLRMLPKPFPMPELLECIRQFNQGL